MKAFLILGAAALVPLGGCAWFDGDDDDDDRVGQEGEYRPDDRETGRVPGTVMDPVSGEPVKTTTMFQTVWEGRTYYFNSRETMDRFTRNPSAYVDNDGNPLRDRDRDRDVEEVK